MSIRSDIFRTKFMDSRTNQHNVFLFGVKHNDFLLYQASTQTSSSIASVAQIGNPVACIPQSTTLGT